MEHLKKNTISFNFSDADERLQGVVNRTPLQLNANLSRKYQCSVYLKREDLQVVRSYKLRGAYNLMSSLMPEELAKGVVCASAGNHAQGFAYCCKKLNVKGVVFMPIITPKQKGQPNQNVCEDKSRSFLQVILR
jgi:threonine dehydratase